MPLPAPYRHWQHHARRLLAPLAALMRPGHADLAIAGRPSDHDRQADRLESFARPLLLAAFYLQSERDDEAERDDPRVNRESLAEWFRAGLVAGSDPRSPHHWGPDANYHQHHVEMGLIAIALQLAPRELWVPLTPAEKERVAQWFATSRGSGIVNNNHLFMSVHILEFLGACGYEHRTDRAVIAAHLNQLETMHRGGGWFEDGINQAYDHYNAYAFHFYGLWWARLHGRGDDERLARARRWRGWTRRFVEDYQHFFAASGEHPAFGRSIAYRFNASNVFGLAHAECCAGLAPGLLRRLCTRNLDFFLKRPIFQEQGCLASGFTDRFDAIVEPYSCAASPYWAAKGFTALLMPPSDPFWNEPEQPLPAERGDFARAIPAAGLVVRGVSGAVEILNAGSMVSNTQTRYGPWKWSKTAYRTGVHFTYAFPEASAYSFDSALTQELDDGRTFGRHSTVAVELDEHHAGYSYNLGARNGQVNTTVETFVWWKAGWLLQVHRYEARQPVVLRVGGYALPLAAPAEAAANLTQNGRDGGLAGFFATEGGTVLQPLGGFAALDWDHRVDDDTPRRHVAAPYHVTPLAKTGRVQGAGWLVALVWTGADRGEGAPWLVTSGLAGRWTLLHPQLGPWEVSHWALPSLP